jgi:hypothetical protein
MRQGTFLPILLLLLGTLLSLLTITVSAKKEVCPDVKCEPGKQYYPHPKDCDKFCHCANGVPYLRSCPGGLLFNRDTNICDWADNVDCDDDGSSCSDEEKDE